MTRAELKMFIARHESFATKSADFVVVTRYLSEPHYPDAGFSPHLLVAKPDSKSGLAINAARYICSYGEPR